eukprot:14269961-Ditylum_brightwellii.AAC.1
MERRYEERSSSFTISKGRAAKGGKQKKQALLKALKEAVAELKETNPKFRGLLVLNHLHDIFFLNVDLVDEFQLSDNWNKGTVALSV